MSDLKLVRTKTGAKLHLAPLKSARTFCGIRYVAPVYLLPPRATFPGCQACGLPAEITAESARQWLPHSA